MSKEKKPDSELKQAIQRRIGELTREIETCVKKKEQFQRAMKDLDTKITQLVGGITELQALDKLDDQEEQSGRGASSE